MGCGIRVIQREFTQKSHTSHALQQKNAIIALLPGKQRNELFNERFEYLGKRMVGLLWGSMGEEQAIFICLPTRRLILLGHVDLQNGVMQMPGGQPSSKPE